MELSKRESQICRLISAGLTSKEISDKIFVSLSTVETHRKNIIKKLKPFGVKNLSIYCAKNY